jgi:hypothetical protein
MAVREQSIVLVDRSCPSPAKAVPRHPLDALNASRNEFENGIPKRVTATGATMLESMLAIFAPDKMQSCNYGILQ